MEDLDKVWANVVQSIEKLCTNVTTTHEKERVAEQVLSIPKEGKDARTLICFHSQEISFLVSLLKSKIITTKVNVSSRTKHYLEVV